MTAPEADGVSRKVTRYASLFSTMSTNRKSNPNAAPVSGTALMNRTAATVGLWVETTRSGWQELTTPTRTQSVGSREIRRINDSLGLVPTCLCQFNNWSCIRDFTAAELVE